MEQSVYILDDIKVSFDFDDINKKLRIRSSEKAGAILTELIKEASRIARPKAAFMFSGLELEKNSEKDLSIGGVFFSSDLLYQKVQGLSRVFPYVATEGEELAQWSRRLKGTEKIFANSIENYAVDKAQEAVEEFIVNKYGISQVSAMNPGSLMAWPITQQEDLFRLLGDLPEQIGVSLLPSYMMNPEQTVSGILFQSDAKFHNCELCPKNQCPSRQVPYKSTEN